MTIELESNDGNRDTAMAPLNMPELLDLLTETLTPTTEEEANKYLARSVPYLQAFVAQVSPRSDMWLSHMIEIDRPHFLH